MDLAAATLNDSGNEFDEDLSSDESYFFDETKTYSSDHVVSMTSTERENDSNNVSG